MDDLKSKFIHITGSVPAACPEHDVALTRLFVAELATGVLRGGGGLVVLVNKGEPNSTIPFDWDIIGATAEFESALRTGRILLRTVRRSDYQSALSEPQQEMLGRIAQNTSDEPIAVRDWTGGVIRRRQAQQADAAVVIGGSRGVEDTARLMSEAGKPVLPLNFHLGEPPQNIGGPRLYEDSLGESQTLHAPNPPRADHTDRRAARARRRISRAGGRRGGCHHDRRAQEPGQARTYREDGANRLSQERPGSEHNLQSECGLQPESEHSFLIGNRRLQRRAR